jgi:sporulation protein YlmC with PRC-barrel domain
MIHRTRLLAAVAAAGLFASPVLAQSGPPGNAPAARPLPSEVTQGTQSPNAVQRGLDAVTGNRGPSDTPGSTVGRAVDRAIGTNTGPAPNAARTGTSGAALAVDSGALRGGKRASKVIGAPVYNENNESIGEVDDLLIPGGGSAPVAVISVGGFLGIGAKLVAVPYDRLQAAGGNASRWTLTGATKDSLGSLPTFTYDGQPDRRG